MCETAANARVLASAYAPLIERIEEGVDDSDEAILALHSGEEEQENEEAKSNSHNNPHYRSADALSGAGGEVKESGGLMLRHVGDCRKKVRSLYRLLGKKADVIKGFLKRCTEQWDVVPRSETGLYLGNIQDCIVIMTRNLSYYEK